MAMLPFCGYNFADYFAHWLSIGKSTDTANLPKIFFVNWFRRDEDGRFLWPGFGENSRVLKWVFERVNGDAEAVETPIGLLPTPDALDTDGLEIADDDLADAARRRHRRLAGGRPADPRALRPVRLRPPGLADRRPRHPRRPPAADRARPCRLGIGPHRADIRQDSPVGSAQAPPTTMSSLSSAQARVAAGVREVVVAAEQQPAVGDDAQRLDRLARHPERVAETDVAGVDRRQRDAGRDRGSPPGRRPRVLASVAVGVDVAQVDLVDPPEQRREPRPPSRSITSRRWRSSAWASATKWPSTSVPVRRSSDR